MASRINFFTALLTIICHALLGGAILGGMASAFDSSSSCSSSGGGLRGRAARAHVLAESIPCDLRSQGYCNQPGKAYPWHAVRRFVHENQGLMRRMYGDQRHLSVLRAEMGNALDDNPESAYQSERYSRHGRRPEEENTKYVYLKQNDIYFRPTTQSPKKYQNDKNLDKNAYKTDAHPEMSGGFEPMIVTLDELTGSNSVYQNVSSDLDEIKTTSHATEDSASTDATSTAWTDATGTDDVDSTGFELGTTEDMELISDTTVTPVAEDESTATPKEIITDKVRTDQNKSPDNQDYKSNIDLKTSITSESPVTSEVLDGKHNAGTSTGGTVTFADDPPNPPKVHQEVHQESKQPAEAAPTMQGMLFQEHAEHVPPPKPRGVNACPVIEEVVAPFWANNTRGETLALLNLYPFEQYVHWEKCSQEFKQMSCREGCRCEQQYRLHRLLAYDPHNECRGIFSDWFRFPSCCVCKCYDVPVEFRVTSRSPRSRPTVEEPRSRDVDSFVEASEKVHQEFVSFQRQHNLLSYDPDDELGVDPSARRDLYMHAAGPWYRHQDTALEEDPDQELGEW